MINGPEYGGESSWVSRQRTGDKIHREGGTGFLESDDLLAILKGAASVVLQFRLT